MIGDTINHAKALRSKDTLRWDDGTGQIINVFISSERGLLHGQLGVGLPVEFIAGSFSSSRTNVIAEVEIECNIFQVSLLEVFNFFDDVCIFFSDT